MEAERRGPLVVECTRGPAVESRHLVDVAVVDPGRPPRAGLGRD